MSVDERRVVLEGTANECITLLQSGHHAPALRFTPSQHKRHLEALVKEGNTAVGPDVRIRRDGTPAASPSVDSDAQSADEEAADEEAAAEEDDQDRMEM